MKDALTVTDLGKWFRPEFAFKLSSGARRTLNINQNKNSLFRGRQMDVDFNATP